MLLTTPEAQIGWKAQPFTLSDPDGNTYSLIDVLGENGLLIAFICNHCPYVQAIVDPFVIDADAIQNEGVNVVAINSNDYRYVPADSPRMMRRFAEQHQFSFPYLVDEDQSVDRSYCAVCTPDFFGFNGAGELHYRGCLGDASMGNAENRTSELLRAMRQIAFTGQDPTEQSPGMGCSIKWSYS